MHYVEADEARQMPGTKLILTAGAPAPWGESAKAVFHVKGLPYIAVRQRPGEDNPELVAWIGLRNAPVVVPENGPPIDRWSDIVLFAERQKATPALLPESSAERALAFGLSNEICGERGFAWSWRALQIAKRRAAGVLAADAPFARAYGGSSEEVSGAPGRVTDVLKMLGDRLKEQARAGSRYLVGRALSMSDLHLACFLNIVDPLPHEVCPTPEMMRKNFEASKAEFSAAVDPVLSQHRAFIYDAHLKLPLDF